MTFNEPNGLLIAHGMVPPQAIAAQVPMLAAASAAMNVSHFIGGPAFGHAPDMLDNMLKAHHAAKAAIKRVRPNLSVGATLAIVDEQASGADSKRHAMRKTFYGAWLDNFKEDDFVGVQNDGRNVWDAKGRLPSPPGSKLNSEKTRSMRLHSPEPSATCTR